MFAGAPFDALYVGPQFHAHRSAFSPVQALICGSVTASEISWAMNVAMMSAALLPLGLVANVVPAANSPPVPAALFVQAAWVLGFPMNPYLMFCGLPAESLIV